MEFSAINQAIPRLLYISRIDSSNALSENESYARRVTDHYEIDLITGGHGCIETNGQIQETSPGMVFFRVPGMEVCGRGGYHCYHTGFLLDFFEPADAPFDSVLPLRDSGGVQAELTQLYHAFLEGSELLELLSKKCLLSVLYLLSCEHRDRGRSQCKRGGPCAQAVLEAAEEIRSHPEKAYCLQELAGHAHVSKYHFCRMFKELMGDAPLTYANRCRVRQVQRMLLETNLSLQQIMDACGYRNEAQFYQMFKRYTGDTPAHYRRSYTLR